MVGCLKIEVVFLGVGGRFLGEDEEVEDFYLEKLERGIFTGLGLLMAFRITDTDFWGRMPVRGFNGVLSTLSRGLDWV